MSKLMTRLEKLNEFQERGENLKKRAAGLQAESQNLDVDVQNWMQNELGLKGQHHITEIIKVALESSFETKAQSIITAP